MADAIPLPSKWPLWERVKRYYYQDPVQVVESTREAYVEKAHSSEVYPMRKRIHGRCLLLMNAKFPKKLIHDSGQVADKYYNKRIGTYPEWQHMRQLFQQLGFIVVSRLDKTAMEMNEYLEMERHHSYHEVAECFVCVISTYGTQRHIFGTDGGKMTYRSILQKFDDFHCPALKGKPKLFFIHSSSGVQDLYKDRNTNVTEDEAQRYLGFVPWIELPPDMFLLLPNIPGFAVWNFLHGGVLCETFVYIFERWAHSHDLETLINAVTRLAKKCKHGAWFNIGKRRFQIPTYFSTMKRKLYFFPGQSETETIELHPSIPEEIRHMSPDAVNLYLKILETGVERRNNIRLMMVGLYATGKTSLARRLMGQGIEDVESTDGIEINKRRCTVSLEDGVWSTTMNTDAEIDPSSRLAALMRENSKDGHSPERGAPEGQSNILNDEVVPPSASLPERNLLDKTCEYLDIYRFQFAVTTALIACLVMSILMHQNTGWWIILFLGVALVVVIGLFAWAQIVYHHLESELERNIEEHSESAVTEDELGCIQSVRKRDPEQLKHMRRLMEKTSSKSPTTRKKVTVSIWDFAGQFVYYSTHQLFLSPRAIYIVALKLTNDLADCITDDIWFMDANGKRDLQVHAGYKFWLRSLYSYIGGSSEHRNVILVGTHKDKIKGVRSYFHFRPECDTIPAYGLMTSV